MARPNLDLKSRIIKKYGTQGDFAQVVKMAEPLVSRVINGRRMLSDEHVRMWSEKLEIRTDELFRLLKSTTD